MADVTCGRCGAAMVRRLVAALCGPGQPGPIYDLICSSGECRDAQRADDRAGRAAADERALQAALASGLIVPDDTPEADRWV